MENRGTRAFEEKQKPKAGHEETIWSNYSDLTRPLPKWWFSKGNHLISGKSRLVKYYNLDRTMKYWLFKVPGSLFHGLL